MRDFGVMERLRATLGDVVLTEFTVDRSRAQTVGVFQQRGSYPALATIGGRLNRSYEVCPLTLLVRWGRDGRAAAVKAYEIHDALVAAEDEAGYFKAIFDGPISIGMDERGVHEFTIDVDVYTKKEGN